MTEKKKPAAKKAPAKASEYASKSAHDKLRSEFNDLKDRVSRALSIDFDSEG